MLILFRFCIAIDRLLASRTTLREAQRRARHAAVVHRGAAVDHLLMKLRDPRRGRSRRELRLAVAEAIRLTRAA